MCQNSYPSFPHLQSSMLLYYYVENIHAHKQYEEPNWDKQNLLPQGGWLYRSDDVILFYQKTNWQKGPLRNS